MTSPDPRYAGGSTPWDRYEVPALAGFLDEDLSPSWSQVTAWWLAHDLTAEHLRVMRQARDTIVRAWPPTVSEAAQAFVDQLDALIASMESMQEAAAANSQALGGILTVLAEAKNSVDVLHEQWKGVASTARIDASMAAGLASGDPLEFGQAYAASKQKALLNAQARQVMRQTDQSAYEYLPRLVVVQPVGQALPSDISPPGGSSGPTGTGPGSGRRSTPSSSAGAIRRPVIPPPAAPASTTGPTLSGSQARTLDIPIDDGGSTASRMPIGETSPSGIGNPAGILVSPWVQTSVGRVLRAGAVIGAPQQDGTAGGASIDPTPTGHEPAQSGGRLDEMGPGLWGGGVGGSRTSGRDRKRILPTDTEWTVPQGVPPVVEPGPEPVHDPGPGVIGIDR